MSESSQSASDIFRQAPQAFIDVGGSEVAYRRVGSGPDVLFVHGWPVSGATFRRLLPHLADSVTCHLIDLPGTGSSRFSADSPLSVDGHIESVRRVVDYLGVDRLAVVGHDSGGLIARHALAGDERLAAMGLINTEPSDGVGWRFRSFLLAGRAPGFGPAFARLIGNRRLRRSEFVLGGAFVDRSLLDGEFDEFFLMPLRRDRDRVVAAVKVLRSFGNHHLSELAGLHRRIDAPVQLVWGTADPFFPAASARAMVASFPNAALVEIDRAALFSHEERPKAVASALLPVLTGGDLIDSPGSVAEVGSAAHAVE